MILKLLYIVYSKSAKITLSVCVAVGKFVWDVNGGKPVRSFFVYVTVTCNLKMQNEINKYIYAEFLYFLIAKANT